MMKICIQKCLLISGLVLAVIFMNLPVVYSYFYHDIYNTPKAVNGNINLSSVSMMDRKIYLDGQWEFYKSQLIVSEPEKISDSTMIIMVPDEWSQYKVDGKNLTAEGYGSYKLKLTGLDYDDPVTLYVPDFGGAYRVFIDGQLTAESGTVSTNIERIFTTPKAELYPIILTAGITHEAVIEVATTRFSGLYMTPVLSDYNTIVRESNSRNAIRFILFGIALFSFFCLAIIYTIYIRRRLLTFWLPIMIFFIIIRIMLTTEFYSVWQDIFFFNLSYESTNELMYFTTFSLKYILIFLVQDQCGIKFNKKEKTGFLVYYVFLYSIYIFAPQSIYNHYLSVLVPTLTYVLDVYLFIKIYRGRQKLNRLGMVVFWSTILLITGLTIDSYYINGKILINMSLMMLLCFTVFALIMSWVYAMRIADLYDNFIKTSSSLELASSQIQMQKEYYTLLSGQMNEIREVKHDIRHFIGVMSRLADENKFDEMKDFIRKYSEKTEIDQLPVFCENIIANSVIGYYYMRAKEYGISLKSRSNISRNSVLSDIDLCIVLGNALENAVDACKKMGNSEVRYISVEAGKMKGHELFKVINTYNGIMKVSDGRFISLKNEKSHGLGIKNIRKVIESYGGFLDIEYNEKEFILKAAVPEK